MIIMKIEIIGEKIPQQEIDAYVAHVKNKNPNRPIEKLTITVDGDFVDLKYEFSDIPFQRIRRIMGYLVGSLERFNDGKRAEVYDRVTHNIY